MNRVSSALSISMSLLALAVAGFVLSSDRSSNESADSSVFDREELAAIHSRLDDFEERLARVVSQRSASSGDERASRAVAVADTSDETDGSEFDDDGEGEAPSDGEGAILARLEAVETRLRGLEEDPIQRAFTYLESESAELRRRGVYELENLAKNDPEARKAIYAMLEDADASVRIAALDTLTDIGDKDVIPLAADLLDDESSRVRREAINTLTRLRATDSAAQIAAFLEDEDREVRALAVDSMGKLGHKAAATGLLSALGDDHARVVGEAISSLGEIGASEALPRLQDLYKNQTPENMTEGRDYRVRLAMAMKQLGDRSAVQAEIERLGELVLNASNERSRGGAWRGLQWIGRGDPAARPILEQLSTHRVEWIRREAQRMLGDGNSDGRKSRRDR